MKKKLLAVILSVVMLAALLVPMMAISAADAPTFTIGLGTPTLVDKAGGKQAIAIPVLISENTGSVFAIRYQVVSTDGLAPYIDTANYDYGYTAGSFEQVLGPFTVKLANQINTALELDGNKGFQCLHDANGGPTSTEGVQTASGTLITLYFEAPTEVGSYDFELIWMDGADNQKIQFDVTVTEPVTYTKECTSHVAGTPEVTKEATCTAAGEKVTKCTACGAEMDKETIPALGHDWDDGVVAEGVKCGETADTTFTCKREGCGETRKETGAKVEHAMVADEANSKAATCTEDGVEATKCAREGCTYTESKTIAKLGHDMVADEANSKAATCTEDGVEATKCAREGCTYTESKTIAKLGHDMVADEENSKAATCYAEGVEATKCAREGCTYTETKAIEKTAHNFSGEFVVVTAPTAEAEGKYTIACANEGCTEVEEYVAAKLATVVEHKDEDGNVVIGFKAEEPILPEDVLPYVTDSVEDKETGKISETIVFTSDLVGDLSGEAEFSIDAMGLITNPVVTAVDAEGNTVVVESTFVDGVLTFNVDLAGEYTLTYEEVKTSPDTSDATNTVVFAVVALIAVAGLVVVGKKRFAL